MLFQRHDTRIRPSFKSLQLCTTAKRTSSSRARALFFFPRAHRSVWVCRRAPAPSLSLNRIPFLSLWALTTTPASVPASGSLPILWLSPCPWPTPFFLWHAHSGSSLFPEGGHTLYSILFCSYSRPRSSASFLLSLVGALQPSFLSFCWACALSGARMLFLSLLPSTHCVSFESMRMTP